MRPLKLSQKPFCIGFPGAMRCQTAELVWRTVFQSRTEAIAAIGHYIDGFYNPVRRHSALDFISPLQFERQAA